MTRPLARRRGPLRALAVSVAAALAVAPLPAASAPAALPATLSARNGHVLVTLDLSTVFAPALERQLGNGLTNLVTVLVSLAPEQGGQPVALYGRVVEILFDVWDETYGVTVKDQRAPAGMRLVLADFAAVRALLAHERDLDLGPVSALPRGRLVVEARVELNPVSKEQLQRTREYIANPAAGARPGSGASRSVLGAVASFLLREPDPSADVHLLRSRAFDASEVVVR